MRLITSVTGSESFSIDKVYITKIGNSVYKLSRDNTAKYTWCCLNDSQYYHGGMPPTATIAESIQQMLRWVARSGYYRNSYILECSNFQEMYLVTNCLNNLSIQQYIERSANHDNNISN